MSLSVQPSTQLKLRTSLSPRMIQRLQLSQLPYPALLESLSQAVTDNPFLEITRPDGLLFRPKTSDQAYSEVDFVYASPVSLLEHVSTQLSVMNLSEDTLAMLMVFLESLDDQGYLPNYDEVKQTLILKFGISDRKVFSLLKLLWQLDPVGVGARSEAEFLLLQIQAHPFDHPELEAVITAVVRDFLPELAAKADALIASKLSLPIESVSALREFISTTFLPYPAYLFRKQRHEVFMVPSFEVSLDQGELVIINLEAKFGPNLGLNASYMEMLNRNDLDAKTRLFLKTQHQNAVELLANLAHRESDLSRLVRAVSFHQRPFLERGPAFLLPLLQKELSDSLSISRSTVSRLLSSKSIQTPYGVFLLSSLCPRRYFGQSSVRLKAMITQLCHDYPDVSDEKIRDFLAQMGVFISRRSVAHYRLNYYIPPIEYGL